MASAGRTIGGTDMANRTPVRVSCWPRISSRPCAGVVSCSVLGGRGSCRALSRLQVRLSRSFRPSTCSLHGSQYILSASVELISSFLYSYWRHTPCHGALLRARPPDPGRLAHATIPQTLSPAARSTVARLRLEPLEDRRLLALVTVTTVDDTIDFTDGVTSLREAIFATNTVPGADTIDFAPALTAAGPATILLTLGELRITDSLTINGPGRRPLDDRCQRK